MSPAIREEQIIQLGIESLTRKKSAVKIPNVGYQRAYIELKTGTLAPEIDHFGRTIDIAPMINTPPSGQGVSAVVSSASASATATGPSNQTMRMAESIVRNSKSLKKSSSKHICSIPSSCFWH